MTELSSLLDTYALRARLLPALAVVLPVGVALGFLLPTLDYQRVVVALAISAGVPIFLANAVRSRGRRLEATLTLEWDGMPTTRLLRWREPSNNARQLARRRDRLEKITAITLPTEAEEATDPADADHTYIAATKALITRIRETKDRYDLIQRENTDYGYRRNLLAVRPMGLTVLAVLLLVDVAAAIGGAAVADVAAAGVIHAVFAAAWLVVVRRSWVREQADIYARQLFGALEDPALGDPREGASP